MKNSFVPCNCNYHDEKSWTQTGSVWTKFAQNLFFFCQLAKQNMPAELQFKLTCMEFIIGPLSIFLSLFELYRPWKFLDQCFRIILFTFSKNQFWSCFPHSLALKYLSWKEINKLLSGCYISTQDYYYYYYYCFVLFVVVVMIILLLLDLYSYSHICLW